MGNGSGTTDHSLRLLQRPHPLPVWLVLRPLRVRRDRRHHGRGELHDGCSQGHLLRFLLCAASLPAAVSACALSSPSSLSAWATAPPGSAARVSLTARGVASSRCATSPPSRTTTPAAHQAWVPQLASPHKRGPRGFDPGVTRYARALM